jgi:hypothetical protein
MAESLSGREAAQAEIARLRDLDLPGFRNNHNGFGLFAAAQNRSGRPRRPLYAILGSPSQVCLRGITRHWVTVCKQRVSRNSSSPCLWIVGI